MDSTRLAAVAAGDDYDDDDTFVKDVCSVCIDPLKIPFLDSLNAPFSFGVKSLMLVVMTALWWMTGV